MAQKLGKIEKPSLQKFSSSRKLLCVPLIPDFHSEKVQKDFQEKSSLYWKQATKQVANLEKAGKIARVYHEYITSNGKSALNTIKHLNAQSFQLVKSKCEQGARLEVVEDQETLDEHMDWSICLSVIGRSRKVADRVISFQKKAAEKRYQYIAQRINATLKDSSAGLLIMTDENRMQLQRNLPADMQILLVHPPAFNDVQRWFREYLLAPNKAKNV